MSKATTAAEILEELARTIWGKEQKEQGGACPIPTPEQLDQWLPQCAHEAWRKFRAYFMAAFKATAQKGGNIEASLWHYRFLDLLGIAWQNRQQPGDDDTRKRNPGAVKVLQELLAGATGLDLPVVTAAAIQR